MLIRIIYIIMVIIHVATPKPFNIKNTESNIVDTECKCFVFLLRFPCYIYFHTSIFQPLVLDGVICFIKKKKKKSQDGIKPSVETMVN